MSLILLEVYIFLIYFKNFSRTELLRVSNLGALLLEDLKFRTDLLYKHSYVYIQDTNDLAMFMDWGVDL